MTSSGEGAEKCLRVGVVVAILSILALATITLALAGCRQTEPADRAPGPDVAPDAQAGSEPDEPSASLADGTPHDVTVADFDAQVLQAETLVLVDFWAEWCGPCRMMHPILQSLAEKYEGKLAVARVDVDVAENRSLAQQYNIRGIPRILLFKDGEIVGDWTGVSPDMEKVLADAIDEALTD